MNNYLKGVLLTLLGVLVITPDSLLIRLIDEDSASINFWRGVFIFISVTAYLTIIKKIKLLKSIKELNFYDYLGLIFFCTGSLFFVYAINNNSVAITLVLLSTAPFFASILSVVFLREGIALSMIIGIVCCFLGVLIIISEELFFPSMQDKSVPFSWLAFFSALLCALSFASNFTLSRSGKQSNIVLSFGLSGILVALCSFFFASNLTLSADVWHWMLINGLVIIPVSFILMLIGAKYIPSPYSTMMLQLETFLGPLWVWLVLNEYPGLLTFVGGAIIIGSLIIVNLLKLKKSPI